jgi:hypothetical protein
VFLTRELSTNHQLQAGFLTCVFQKNPSRSFLSSGTTSFGLATYIATDAYSGATVTDFNRVPFPAIGYYFSKEQTQSNTNKNLCKQKIISAEKT